MPKIAKEDVFAIRCFKNNKRIFTDKFTKQEAKIFCKTAKHLLKYLNKEYQLDV